MYLLGDCCGLVIMFAFKKRIARAHGLTPASSGPEDRPRLKIHSTAGAGSELGRSIMSRDTFVFTSSTLRSLRLQRELLDLEEQRRALRRYPTTRLTRPVSQGDWEPRNPPQICRDSAVHNALFSGDLDKVRSIFKNKESVNAIVETVAHELCWSAELGLWSLAAKPKQTTALCIAAERGYTACLKHLLGHGADIHASYGGTTALHKACANGRHDCALLLLSIGSDPNAFSEDGFAPLHLCTSPQTLQCANLLLDHGARVNILTQDGENSPLHVAAKHGLCEHADLYLSYCAYNHRKNREGETALNAACAHAESREAFGRYFRVCKLLIDCGAEVRTAGRKSHTPLHNACGNGHHRVVDLLLQHGASVNVRNCAGYSPMDCTLQAVEDHLEINPELIVLALLNHGAAAIPPKWLKLCAVCPRTTEAVLNSYECVPLCDSWIQAVPPDVWQRSEEFYESVIGLTNKPRSLQHLARFAIRKYLGVRCHSIIPQLKIPSSFKEFLLLKIEGYIR